MVDQGAILTKLRAVKDPELQQNIVDLHMVRAVDVDATGQVHIEIALTVSGCPLHEQIEHDVRQAIMSLGDVREVSVDLSVMDAEERKKAFAAAFQRSSHQSQTLEPKIGTLPGQPRTGGSDIHAATIIGVASGKGGVGKSTVTANLAVALSRIGARVGLMDLDIYGFSQGRMFGAREGAKSNEQDKLLPWRYHDVSVVSMGMFVPENQAIIWRGPMLGKIMDQFFQDVAWPELDFLLIDLPPGTGDVALNVAQKLPAASLIMVTTPQSVATQVARRAAEVAVRAHQSILGVIENMSYLTCPHGEVLHPFGEDGGRILADELGVPLLGQVPLEAEVRHGGDTGSPITVAHPNSEAAQAFLTIAEKIKGAAGR